MIAFIMINTSAGSEEKVLEQLSRLKGVLELHLIYGAYDLLAKVEIDESSEKDEIIWKIRQIKDVQSTTTLIVSKSLILR